jgi:ribonuclease HI
MNAGCPRARDAAGGGPGRRSWDVVTIVYTDGACIGNPGPGGWAWAVPDGAWASGAEAESTNQRMELRAALEALRAVDGPVEVRSDSRYLVDGCTKRWYVAWEAKGWKNAKGQPVANQDLWKPLVALFRARGSELTMTWVKGHGDDPWNDVVDRLATAAAAEQRELQGSTPPTQLGPADRVGGPARPSAGARATAPGAVVDGHRVVVLGHRPPQLGGYEENPVATAVRRRLTEILAGLVAVHPDLVVLTGLGLGAEQLGAEAAQAAAVPYVAVLPFPDPDAVWPAASRERFRQLVDGARAVVVRSSERPSSKQAAGMAIGRRDEWLLAQADGALVVWDGKDPLVGRTVQALERRVPDDVWVVPPEG